MIILKDYWAVFKQLVYMIFFAKACHTARGILWVVLKEEMQNLNKSCGCFSTCKDYELHYHLRSNRWFHSGWLLQRANNDHFIKQLNKLCLSTVYSNKPLYPGIE